MFEDGIQLGNVVSIDNKALKRMAKLLTKSVKLAKAMADILRAQAEVIRAEASLQVEHNLNRDRDVRLAQLGLDGAREEYAVMKEERDYNDVQAQKLSEVLKMRMPAGNPFSTSGLFGEFGPEKFGGI